MSLSELRNKEWFPKMETDNRIRVDMGGQGIIIHPDSWVSTTGGNALIEIGKDGFMRVDDRGLVLLPFQSSNIVELGGGEKPYFHPNVDVRQLLEVDIVRDLEEDFSDIGKFDGIFGNYVLEHISWKKVETFIKSCYNILNPGGYAIFVVPNTYEQMEMVVKKGKLELLDSCTLFGGQSFTDNVHKWALSPRLIRELFTTAGFSRVECYDHPNLACWDMFIVAHKGEESHSVPSVPSDIVAINFGSFVVSFPAPFINADIRGDIKGAVESKGHKFMELDVRGRLPWSDNSVDYITHHHLLEHLTDEEGEMFLKECYRILKVNGVMRFSVPDPKKLVKLYFDENIRSLDDESDEVKNAKYSVDAFYTLLTSGHKSIYDWNKIYKILTSGGFLERYIKQEEHHTSEHRIFESTTELFPKHSIFVEATKNITTSQSVEGYKKYLEEE